MQIQNPQKKRTICYSKDAWDKMCALIDKCDKEIAWHFVARRGQLDSYYHIDDIIMFPQTVTSATVTSDEQEYAAWVSQLPDETFWQLKGHGHSHVNMGTSPSSVDTDYQLDILNNGISDFYIFAIWNKKGANYHIIYDAAQNMVYEDADIELELPVSRWSEWAEDTINNFVKDTAKTTQTYGYWDRFLDYPDDDSEFDAYLEELALERGDHP